MERITRNNASSNQTTTAPGALCGTVNININYNFNSGAFVSFTGYPSSSPTPPVTNTYPGGFPYAFSTGFPYIFPVGFPYAFPPRLRYASQNGFPSHFPFASPILRSSAFNHTRPIPVAPTNPATTPAVPATTQVDPAAATSEDDTKKTE